MRDIWLKHSKIWLPVKSMSLLYSAFSLRLSSLEGRTWVVFRIPPSPWLWAISEASPAVPLPGAAFRTCIQGCCWTNEWSVYLGFPVSCTFFSFGHQWFLPMITFSLLNREWWVYWEGPGGAGEGGWDDCVSYREDWPLIVIFSS